VEGAAFAPRHNVLWCCLLEPDVRKRFLNVDEQMPRMVATLRAAFAQHLGEPAWTEFIRQLGAASPDFAVLWARHDVAKPAMSIKQLLHPRAGLLSLHSTTLAVAGMPEARIIVYTPADQQTRDRLPLTRS
jgi:hypothetical protein